MKATTLVGAALWLAGAAWNARATPSTLVWIPSTDIQAEGTWHLGIDDYFPSHEGESAPTDVGLTYGGRRWEAGVDYFGGTDDPLAFNGKVLLAEEAAQGASFAAGIYGAGTNSDTTAFDIAYGLASKTFRGTRVTAGYFKGRKRLLGEDESGLLLGVDRMVGDGWWAAVDYQSGRSAFGALSAGAAYSFAPEMSLLVGFVDYRDASLDDTVTTQVDVNF